MTSPILPSSMTNSLNTSPRQTRKTGAVSFDKNLPRKYLYGTSGANVISVGGGSNDEVAKETTQSNNYAPNSNKSYKRWYNNIFKWRTNTEKQETSDNGHLNLETGNTKRTLNDLRRDFSDVFECQRNSRHNMCPGTETKKLSFSKLSFISEDFDDIRLIGKGAFADVYVCRHIQSNQYVVVKEISQQRTAKVDKAKELLYLESEVKILHQLSKKYCPYITHILGSFQDKENTYYIMDYYPGGELYSYIQANPCFAESHAKFYAAEVIYAIHYMHDILHIAYRDIKPENILLDKDGHIVLCDFGHAKQMNRGEITYSLCGTPDYSAPELVEDKGMKGHGLGVDIWAFGVLVYEMLYGITPFHSPDRYELCKNIIRNDVTYSTTDAAANFSSGAVDLISKLLKRDPMERLGTGDMGVLEIMAHPWFDDIDWTAIHKKEMKSPFTPNIRAPNDSFYYTLELNSQNLHHFVFDYKRNI